MSSKKSTLFLSPPKAGSTTLLAVAQEALRRGGSGFPAIWRFRLEEPDLNKGLSQLSKSYKLGEPPQTTAARAPQTYHMTLHFLKPQSIPPGLKRPFQSANAKPSKSAPPGTQPNATALSPIDEETQPARASFFAKTAKTKSVSLDLVDAPGGLGLIGGASDGEREAIKKELQKTNVLVLVWPIFRIADHIANDDPSFGWAAALGSLLTGPILSKSRKLERAILVFSCYDIALAAIMDRALDEALDPKRVKTTFRGVLRRNPILSGVLQELSAAGVPVDLMPASSYGVIKGYFETNWHPLSNSLLISNDKTAGLGGLLDGRARQNALAAELAELWTPLFVSDILWYAAFGLRHPLIIPLSDATSG